MNWIATLISLLVGYFILSGISFVVGYKWPSWHSPRLATLFFAPLDRLARRWPAFQRLYTGFHFWCYRRLVYDYSKSNSRKGWSDDLTPVNFHISEAARAEILRERAALIEFSPKGWIVAMVWMVNEAHENDAGPGLGWYERHDLPDGSIVTIDGVELVCVLTPRTEKYYEGKVLDLVGNRLLLREMQSSTE